MTSGGKRFATIAAEVTVPEVSRMRILSARSRSINAAAANTSPTLAPWIQTRGPEGRTSCDRPRRSPIRSGSSLPCFRRRLIRAGASGTTTDDSLRYMRSVIGSALATAGLRASDPGIGAAGRLVQIGLEPQAQALHGCSVGVLRHVDLFNADQRTAPERQIDGGAVPVSETDETAGCHRKGHNRPSAFPRQHDDTEAGKARAFRHIGGQGHIIVVLQRIHHLPECAHPAFAMKRAAMVAGAADGADAEPLGGDGVVFAVAMARDQHLGALFLFVPDERRQEMLAVPEHEDRGLARLDHVVDMGRVEDERVGSPDQPKIFGREKPHSTLKPAAAQNIAKQLLQWSDFASWDGSSSRCRWTTK